jgi:hypothetical protein
MLVQDHDPLEHRCRALSSLAAALSAALLIVVASALRIEGAAPADEKPAAKPSQTPAAAPTAQAGRTWRGRITEKGTGKPIAGADVVVKISLSGGPTSDEPTDLREVHHTTGPDGAYEFTVTPEEAAKRLLFITLHVQERDHVGFYGGYSYGMILKNETLGERPFYENLELSPGKAIQGFVQTAEGEPAAGVKVEAFSTASSTDDSGTPTVSKRRTDSAGSSLRTACKTPRSRSTPTSTRPISSGPPKTAHSRTARRASN